MKINIASGIKITMISIIWTFSKIDIVIVTRIIATMIDIWTLTVLIVRLRLGVLHPKLNVIVVILIESHTGIWNPTKVHVVLSLVVTRVRHIYKQTN